MLASPFEGDENITLTSFSSLTVLQLHQFTEES